MLLLQPALPLVLVPTQVAVDPNVAPGLSPKPANTDSLLRDCALLGRAWASCPGRDVEGLANKRLEKAAFRHPLLFDLLVLHAIREVVTALADSVGGVAGTILGACC